MTGRRWLLAAAGTAFALVVAGCSGESSTAADPRTPTTASGVTSPPSRAASTDEEKTGATDSDFAAVKDVLDQRGRALTTGDRAAFMKTLDRGDSRFMAGQRTYFANLQRLPVRSVSYRMQNYALTPVKVPHVDQLLRPDVTERVFLPATDEGAAAAEVAYTFVRRGDRWLLGADGSGPSGNEARADSRPWAGGPIAVEARGPLVVVMDQSAASSVDGLADQVTTDLRSVSTFLHAPLDTHILVDATTTGTTTRVNQLGSGDAAAAAAVTYPVHGAGGIAGWRIKVNPTNISQYLAQAGLLRHELTHFVLRNIDVGNPTWLIEGVAEVAGYWPEHFGDQVVSDAYYRQLLRAPRELPQTPYWSNDPDVNYQVGRAAVDYLVLTYGVDKLLRFMRAYGRFGDAKVDDHTRRLLKQVYDVTEPAVVSGAFRLLAQFNH